MKKHNRLISVALALFMAAAGGLAIFAPPAEAAEYNGSCGDNLTWTLDTDTGLLEISGTGAMTDWEWHESPWDIHRDSIRTVRIHDGVINIGDHAFFSCAYLNHVDIPDSVTAIGTQSFWGCKSLTEVVIPVNVTGIFGWAFRYCDNLYDIYFESTTPPDVFFAFEEVKSGARAIVPSGAAEYGEVGSEWKELVVAYEGYRIKYYKDSIIEGYLGSLAGTEIHGDGDRLTPAKINAEMQNNPVSDWLNYHKPGNGNYGAALVSYPTVSDGENVVKVLYMLVNN